MFHALPHSDRKLQVKEDGWHRRSQQRQRSSPASRSSEEEVVAFSEEDQAGVICKADGLFPCTAVV